MAIVFGSPEAQRVLERDKARAKAEQDMIDNLENMRAELDRVEQEMDDISAEIYDLQLSLRSCERVREKLVAAIEEAERIESELA